MKRGFWPGAVALCAALASGPALADPYLAAIWTAPSGTNAVFAEDWAGRLRDKTDGAVAFEVHSGGALLPAEGTVDGLAAGVAQMAYITALYFPAKMPVDNVLSDMSLVAQEQLSHAFASIEVKLTNPQIQKEYAEYDIVFLATQALGLYNFICSSEVATAADLAGKKIRTGSGAHVGWITALDAVPVSVPASEIYTGLQRGSLDCAIGSPLFLTDYFRLHEVAKSVNLLPMGSMNSGGYFLNGRFWRSLTPEQRRAALDAAAEATADVMLAWADKIDIAFDTARNSDVALIEPDADLVSRLEAYETGFVEALPENSVEKRGIDDPSALIDQLVAAEAKWRELLAGIDATDPQAVAALLKSEIYDGIDVGSYGN